MKMLSGIGCTEDEELFSSHSIRSVVEEVAVDGEKLIRIHTAWRLENGSILVYEYSSRNHPTSSFCLYDTLDEYNELCDDLYWVKKNEWKDD